MKCICGYEHENGIGEDGEWNDFLKGDEEFINIENRFQRYIKGVNEYREVYLYACPKCGTIKMVE